jgi:hypothetical protein
MCEPEEEEAKVAVNRYPTQGELAAVERYAMARKTVNHTIIRHRTAGLKQRALGRGGTLF